MGFRACRIPPQYTLSLSNGLSSTSKQYFIINYIKFNQYITIDFTKFVHTTPRFTYYKLNSTHTHPQNVLSSPQQLQFIINDLNIYKEVSYLYKNYKPANKILHDSH